jgi:DNA-binding transcriptional LysR family regulator
MMTLRQIEVVRAVMVTGTIKGAAKLLGVSAPGVSRLVKHTEGLLRIRFFNRQNGRYFPTPEARTVFEQIDSVYQKVDDLGFVLSTLGRGGLSELCVGSVPSISYAMMPRAIAKVRQRYPDLRMSIDVLKIEEAINYLLLGKGECVAMSYKLDHPGLDFEPLATGQLFCIVPEAHPLAGRESIGAAEITRYPLIGVDPTDPYGRVIAQVFESLGLAYKVPIKARFGSMVCTLVKAGLGIAVIDRFTLASDWAAGVKHLRIEEPTPFDTFIAFKRGAPLSLHAEYFIRGLRAEMQATKPPLVLNLRGKSQQKLT